MKQEDKKLLLKDLCARLPYGVIINKKVSHSHQIEELFDIGYGQRSDEVYINGYPLKKSRPYLRPMSSMSEEEKKERDFYCGYKPYDENIGESYLTEYDMPDYINFLYEHHLDFRGLIPMGLALEAPNGMYKD